MTRQFCNRCGADITDKKSAAVTIVGDADPHGTGEVTAAADLCLKCCHALEAWIKTPDRPKDRRRRRTR